MDLAFVCGSTPPPTHDEGSGGLGSHASQECEDVYTFQRNKRASCFTLLPALMLLKPGRGPIWKIVTKSF